MAIRLNETSDEDPVLSEINTTPLVDVMLVLLIIFLITIPVVNTSIQVQLPKRENQIRETRPENIVISVDANGNTFWFDSKLRSNDELIDRISRVATLKPQPEIQIRGDARANYESIGRIVYVCQRMGITRVGFITEPPPRGG